MNTTIEKIRAEIKIRLSANGAFDEEGDSAWHYDQGLNDAYNYILSFLSDLEKSEKPINQDDIDTEIGHWMSCLDDKYYMLVNHYSIQDIKDTARHFAQWGAEHLKQ